MFNLRDSSENNSQVLVFALHKIVKFHKDNFDLI